MPQLESTFQASLIREIRDRFDGAIVIKNDPNYIQGFPDLLILFGKHWAALEVKQNDKSRHRPNQDYYVNFLNNMSFASFVHPDNKEEVLDAMERSFQA